MKDQRNRGSSTGGFHDATMFSRSLKNISDHIQLKLTSDVTESIQNMKLLSITVPPAPKSSIHEAGNNIPVLEVDFYLLKRDHSKAQDLEDKYEEGMKTAYTIIFHQCSPALKTELEGSKVFVVAST